MIDGRTEITSADRDLAKILRPFGKPVTLVVNKIDVTAREDLVPEFYSLGLGEPIPVSAEHRLGLDELLSLVTAPFPKDDPNKEGAGGRWRSAQNQSGDYWTSERWQVYITKCFSGL